MSSAEPEKDYSSLINPRTKPSEVTSSAQGRQAKELRGQSTSKVMTPAGGEGRDDGDGGAAGGEVPGQEAETSRGCW